MSQLIASILLDKRPRQIKFLANKDLEALIILLIIYFSFVFLKSILVRSRELTKSQQVIQQFLTRYYYFKYYY